MTDDVICQDGFSGIAIVILAPDVTLDGAGFTIDAKSGSGVASADRGTTVKNVTITGSGSHGVRLFGDDAAVQNTTVVGAQIGVLIGDADGVTFTDNAALGCGQGVYFQNIANLTFDAVDVSGSAAGLRFGAVTGPVTVTGTSTFDDMGDGIAISFGVGSSQLHVAGVDIVGTSASSASVGVQISGCAGCTVDDTRIEARAVGVRANAGSTGPHVLHTTVTGADLAFDFAATVDSVCHDSHVVGAARGLSIESSTGTFSVDNNHFEDITDVGMRIATTDAVDLQGNVIEGVAGATGLLMINSDDLTADATAISGFQIGAELDRDSDQSVLNLSVCGGGLGNGLVVLGGTGHDVSGNYGSLSSGVVVGVDAVDTAIDAAFANNSQNVADSGTNTTATESAPDDLDLDGTADFCNDLCVGDDATGDDDDDGICGDTDVCFGTDATGDSDSDGVCDDADACTGDDNTGDSDADAVCDDSDNCVDDANPDQADADADGAGDACDDFNDDFDGDGIANELDNCPFQPNPEQRDRDMDGFGDVCDFIDDGNGDADADGVVDSDDNCPLQSNPDQQDRDNDGFGDVCDGNSFHDDGCQSGGGAGWHWWVALALFGMPRRRRRAA